MQYVATPHPALKIIGSTKIRLSGTMRPVAERQAHTLGGPTAGVAKAWTQVLASYQGTAGSYVEYTLGPVGHFSTDVEITFYA